MPSFELSYVDWAIFAAYVLTLILLAFSKNWEEQDETSFLLSGRSMTLLPFIATLVSTWYGGILGVGEYAYQYGISQWLIFGVPYYLFAILFAWFFAGKIRENTSLTIPEALSDTYDKRTGKWGAVLIFLLVNPAPYILMLGLMVQFLTGTEGNTTLIAGIIALFAVAYISFSGFTAVVRTDILQVVLMFTGFIMLFVFAWSNSGSPLRIWQQLPAIYTDLTGGNNWSYIMVWFFIALWTFVDPGFHQRAAAAKNSKTARNGIFASVILWFFFDFLTVTCGLYSVIILGDSLSEPILAYPALSVEILPAGFLGLFLITLFATIMSTLDSFLFLSGQTLGRDFFKSWLPDIAANTLTRSAMAISALLGVLLLYLIPSVVELWYIIGSVIIPGLLIPVVGIYYSLFRVGRRLIVPLMISSTLVSMIWFLTGLYVKEQPFWGIEPFYPGLLVSILFWILFMTKRTTFR